MKQLTSLSVFGFVFCFFYSEARSCHGACFYEVTVRVPTVLSLRSPLKVLIALFHQKPSFMWKPGMWFHQESRGKLPSLILGEQPSSPVEAFSVPQFTVICTCAVFEPGFQIGVTLSLTRGT